MREHGAAGGNGNGVFEAASADGSKVLFRDDVQLTPDSTAAQGQPDLYMCEISVLGGHLSCALSDLSVDLIAGESASVSEEVSAIDASAQHLYLAAPGVLTKTPNARGETARPGTCFGESAEATCNFYEYDTVSHKVSLVAVLSATDGPDWAHELGEITVRSSPDGRYLAFMSSRSLTGYDNRDLHSGKPDEEVFLYDSQTEGLSCVSCNPTGARPNGLFDRAGFPGPLVDHHAIWSEKSIAGLLPGWNESNVRIGVSQPRYLSDSGRMFFDSSDALVPQDTNSVMDVYQYEPPGVGDCTTASKTYSPASGGCVNAISSGASKEESALLDASETGNEVFFITASRLVSSDIDGSLDVYDAHVCTGSSPCPPPPPAPSQACEGDACQNSTGPPNDATPASLTYKGPGNTAPAPPAKPTAAQLRAKNLAAALSSCRKKYKHSKKRRQACEKKAHKRYPSKSSKGRK